MHICPPRLVCGPLAIVLLSGVSALAADAPKPIRLTISPIQDNRRFIVAEHRVYESELSPPYAMRNAETNEAVACAWSYNRPTGQRDRLSFQLRWVVPYLPAGKSATFIVEHADAAPKPVMTVEKHGATKSEREPGWISIRNATREITRYYFRPAHDKHQKPYFYPLIVHGVPITRAFPMEKKAGEDADHPHHSSIYFAHGEVNGTDYWSKAPIIAEEPVVAEGGGIARIVATNKWGKDLTETQDVLILDAGDDAILDWTITLTAPNGPVVLGKTKEGGFSVRVAQGLVDKSGGQMIDADGNRGEPAIRKNTAVWADNWGTVDGKVVGVAIMNHPKSWRFPTNWHVRGYGLFAANAFMEKGEHRLEKGESITLRYRIYAHGGDPKAANVTEVYAGYANAAVSAN